MAKKVVVKTYISTRRGRIRGFTKAKPGSTDLKMIDTVLIEFVYMIYLQYLLWAKYVRSTQPYGVERMKKQTMLDMKRVIVEE